MRARGPVAMAGQGRQKVMLTLQAAARVSLVLWTAKADAVYAHLMEGFGKGRADGLEAAALGASLEAEPAAAHAEASLTELDPKGGREDLGRFVPVVEREVGGRGVLSVAARDVHLFVGSARGFSNWFEYQRAGGKLRHGVDYVEEVLDGNVLNPTAGRPRKDYELALDAAKEICMMDRGLRGKELRSYFLECERRIADGGVEAHALAAPPAPSVRAVATWPRAASPFMVSADTMPLTLAAYLDLGGLRLTPVRGSPLSVSESGGVRGLEAALARKLLADPATAASCCRHPTESEWVFVRPVLDAWWAENARHIMLASVVG